MSTDAIEALAFFTGFAITAWAAAYAWGKWLAHRFDEQKLSRPGSTVDAERLARLETAVEALAVELERIGEAQRYTVKVLEERLPRALGAGKPNDGGKIVTPH